MSARPVPRATYRLQLNKDFGFRDVAALSPYLGQLGISHAYLSPILRARSGSTHGYDTVDHAVLNPELGDLDAFRAMAAALRREGVGIVLDIVPNHMGIGGTENAYWLDVLEWGRSSRHAAWFDIDWTPSEPLLRNKVLVPFLGRSFAEAIRTNALELRFDAQQGSFAIWAEGTHLLPVTPSSYAQVIGRLGGLPEQIGAQLAVSGMVDATALKRRLAAWCCESPDTSAAIEKAVAHLNGPDGHEGLARLMEAQHWRPARYSVAADDINYRRFFIVSDLAAIRVERDDVFAHVHRLVFQLIEEGLVEGLRIDHIDGLHDPRAYCLKLRREAPRPIYLIVEKILGPHERLPSDWQTDGTTGYEFAAAVTNLLVNRSAEAAFTNRYHQLTGEIGSVAELERDAKREIIDYEMAAELDSLTARLHLLAESRLETRDLTRNALRNGLRLVVSSMPVYRSYLGADAVSPADHRNIAVAVARARRSAPQIDPAVFDFIEAVATGSLPGDTTDSCPTALAQAQARLQQYCAPVMAKGLEDTVLYRHNRLIALNDVGQRPDRFGSTIASFHDFCRTRQRILPNGMLAGSTHDTKRGEDVRARLAAITFDPDHWERSVENWLTLLGPVAGPPLDPNDVYHFLQLLVGAWPVSLDGAPDPTLLAAPLETLRSRLDAAMRKSLREARRHTNWLAPQEYYEARMSALIEAALAPRRDNAFLHSFRTFVRKLGPSGAANGLVAATLRLTAPGVPDIYQGAEFWEQSLVDPDNRRPVNFPALQAALERARDMDVADLLPEWTNGAVKLALCHRLLRLRARLPALFSDGAYIPLRAAGPDGQRILSFMREAEGSRLLVVAALGPRSAALEADIPVPGPDGEWEDCLGTHSRRLGGTVSVASLINALPVAVLLARSPYQDDAAAGQAPVDM